MPVYTNESPKAPPQDVSLTWRTSPLDMQPLQQQWLFSRELLTQQLRDLSQNQFAVQPLQEYAATLRDDECQALHLPIGSQGWIREVILLGKQQPWIYARSVVGAAQMDSSRFDLASLGNRSLGEHLFKQNDFQRLSIEVADFPRQWLPDSLSASTASANTTSAALWARRSCFQHPELSVLVAEIFLPDFWRAAQQL